MPMLLLSHVSDTVCKFIMRGPVMRHEMAGPRTDVVLSESLIGSQTKVASLCASMGYSFLSFVPSRVQDNITIHKEEPQGFEIVCRWVAVFGDGTAVARLVRPARHR